jgi:hypothetical protein
MIEDLNVIADYFISISSFITGGFSAQLSSHLDNKMMSHR